MRRWLLVLLIGCGPQPQPQPQPRPQPQPQPQPEPDAAMAEVIEALRVQKDRMCACTDTSCVEDAEAAQFEWGFEHQELLKRVKPTKAQEAEAHALVEATEECREAPGR